MRLKKYMSDGKIINITSKLKQQEKITKEKLKDINNVSSNMINALSFVIEESRKGKNLKKLKSMLNKIIEELQLTVKDIK